MTRALPYYALNSHGAGILPLLPSPVKALHDHQSFQRLITDLTVHLDSHFQCVPLTNSHLPVMAWTSLWIPWILDTSSTFSATRARFCSYPACMLQNSLLFFWQRLSMLCHLWDSGQGFLPPDNNTIPIILACGITSLEFSRISHYKASASRKKHTLLLCPKIYMQDRCWTTQ